MRVSSGNFSDPRSKQYDVIVIGGGINGTGIARDAAERGLSVLIVDKNDIGSGTTATSTRLIHGGLRYLENLIPENKLKAFTPGHAKRAVKQLELVRESLREREVLLQNAPHLVKPQELGIPIYKDSDRPKWLVKLGMMFYGSLSFDKSMPGFEMFNAKKFLDRFSGIKPDNLTGGASYYDAQINLPERMCVENVIAASETGHADVKNHTRFDSLVLESNKKATGIRYTDLLTGEQAVASGKVIINAGGPWVDDIAKLAVKTDAPNLTPERRMGGTRGSHIIVKRWEGGPERAIYTEAKSDGRPYFIVPWDPNPTADHKRFYLIGTTDIKHDGSLDQIVATDDEIAYLLSESNQILPRTAPLSKEDVLYTTAGVRPLPYADPNLKAGQITREHRLDDHGKTKDMPIQNFLSVVGGKLTTYRNLAEHTVDYALKNFNLTDNCKKPKSTTQEKPLPGGTGTDGKAIKDFETYRSAQSLTAAQQYGIPQNTAYNLIGLYGSRYENILKLTETRPDLKEPVAPNSPNIKAQVVYAIETEFAQTASDVLRRMGSNFNEAAGLDEIDAVANLVGEAKGLTSDEIKRQIQDYKGFTDRYALAFKHKTLA